VIDRLAGFARSPGGLLLIAAWACAEAVLLPIVPDVVLLPLLAAAPRATPRLVLALVVGALVGSAILAWLVLADPDRVRSILVALPGIDVSTLRTVEADLSTHGAAAFAAVGPGVPLKVYTTAWIGAGGSPLVLAGAVVLNRLTRIGPGIVVAAAVGQVAPRALRHHERLALAAYAVGWIALYLLYWRIL
jgi:membrane protein YqaA with SNARE-associated domain